MSDAVKAASVGMELDEAFRQAVTQAWEDLMTPTEPRSVRVEYVCEPGQPLDNLSIWLVRAGGYQDLVCDYWTWTSSAHPTGATFGVRHRSDRLRQALDFVMNNQGQFARPTDACRNGLVQVYPPSGEERTEAATWMKNVRAQESEAGSGEAPKASDDRAQEAQARSRTDNEGHPDQRTLTLPDATGHSG